MLAILFTPLGGKRQRADLDSFARCLQEEQVAMYGAEWCAHCQSQEQLFGDSFRFIRYVECPKNIDTCFQAGINNYPTWIFADGRKLEGEQTLEQLAEVSGCSLP